MQGKIFQKFGDRSFCKGDLYSKIVKRSFCRKTYPNNCAIDHFARTIFLSDFSYLTLKVTYKPVEFAYITNNLKVYISKHNIYSYSWIFAFKGEIEHKDNDFLWESIILQDKIFQKIHEWSFCTCYYDQNWMNDHSWLGIFMRSLPKSWC